MARPASLLASLRRAGIVAAALWLGLGSAGLAARPAAATALLELRALDTRVATIGHRLAFANAAQCAEAVPLSGLLIHSLDQYGTGMRPAAIGAFGLGGGPSILAVVPGGAADRAGIMADDRLLAIEGRPVPAISPEVRRGSFAATEKTIEAIETALADGSADFTLARGARRWIAQIDAPPGCASRFHVVPSSRHRAAADGRYVQLTSALVRYAADDSELAAVLAHELAHNILDHRQRLDEAKVSRGMLRHFGRNARLIRATEVEADRLSVALVARAGYDPAAAARFWQRFGREQGRGIFASATHPGWRRRAAILEGEAARLMGTGAPDAPQAGGSQVDRNQRSPPSRPIAVSRPDS